MLKLRDVLFCMAMAAVLFSVFINITICMLTCMDHNNRSFLEGRVYHELADLNASTLSSSSFQDSAEQFLADRVVGRDYVLLANAQLQRQAISSANVLFGYDAYHTFYESNYVYSPGERRLYEMPYSQVVYEKLLNSAIEQFALFFKSHDDIKWNIALVNRSGTLDSSPAASLVSRKMGYADFEKRLESNLRSACTFVDLSDISSVETNYFAADHHWQVQGAVEAYMRISRALGMKPARFDSFRIVYPGPFYGALARNSLDCDINDALYDVDHDFGTLDVRVDGAEVPMSYLCDAFGDDAPYEKEDVFTNVYADYYHGDPGLLEIRNESAPDHTLLIVGDSFTNNMERFFAENSRYLFVIDPRYYQGTLSDFLEVRDIDDCVFIMSANNLLSEKTVGFLD